MTTNQNNLVIRTRDQYGTIYLCPLQALADPAKVSGLEKHHCVTPAQFKENPDAFTDSKRAA